MRPDPVGPADAPSGGAWGALLRAALVLVTHTLYRLRVVGREHVPRSGGVLLTPNHVSFVDALFLVTATRRPVRFVIERAWYEKAWLRPFVRALGCIPISAEGGPRQILKAMRDAGEGLSRGEVVCIFPEGQLTRTGMLLPFRRGMARLVKGRDAVIVPVYMDRVWGSIFSRERGRFVLKRPKRLPYPVTLVFGAPMPADTPVAEVRRVVQELSVDAWTSRRPDRPPLHHTARRALRRRRLRLAMADATRPKVSGWGALTGAVAIARALRADWAGQERVGILLPPSVGGALVNLAASFAGRVPVNLNYTAGPAGMASAVRQAGLRTVVTSRVFLERAKLDVPEGLRVIWADDLRGRVGAADRLVAAALGLLAPIRVLERACGAERRPSADDVSTILFSSGSTGEPKGVPLTHFNVDSNVEAAMQAVGLRRGSDRLLGILPLFHSFGNLLLWLSANEGVPIVFHVSPLDAEAVGALVERHRVTILVATPTFLHLYMRRCAPGQFGSLRLVVAGAEKLQAPLRDAFREAFGIEPLEGYGTTECAPVVCVSTPDYRAPGIFQPGSRRGSVGQPIPGVAVRIVDPDTFEPRPPEESGMLLVRGPNVMAGYLGRPDLTAAALRDGWYVTGDIGLVDEDGFVWITDRLARFSKIGGEMVPHGRVEQALHDAAGIDAAGGQVFAVTSVADARKGERLAVVHTAADAKLAAALAKLPSMGLPNLFVPRRQDCVRVETLPLLGTGKLDLRAVRRVAEERLAGEEPGEIATGVDVAEREPGDARA